MRYIVNQSNERIVIVARQSLPNVRISLTSVPRTDRGAWSTLHPFLTQDSLNKNVHNAVVYMNKVKEQK